MGEVECRAVLLLKEIAERIRATDKIEPNDVSYIAEVLAAVVKGLFGP